MQDPDKLPAHHGQTMTREGPVHPMLALCIPLVLWGAAGSCMLILAVPRTLMLHQAMNRYSGREIECYGNSIVIRLGGVQQQGWMAES